MCANVRTTKRQNEWDKTKTPKRRRTTTTEIVQRERSTRHDMTWTWTTKNTVLLLTDCLVVCTAIIVEDHVYIVWHVIEYQN